MLLRHRYGHIFRLRRLGVAGIGTAARSGRLLRPLTGLIVEAGGRTHDALNATDIIWHCRSPFAC